MASNKPVRTFVLNGDLLRASLDFAAMRPWDFLDGDQGVAFVVPGEPHPVFGSVMGQAGEEFGFSFTTGPHALWSLHELLYAGQGERTVIDKVSFRGMSLVRRQALPPDWKKATSFVVGEAANQGVFPWIIVKDAGRLPRNPTMPEQEVVLYCLSGLMKHLRGHGLAPGPLHANEEILTLTLSGPAVDPEVKVDVRSYSLEAPRDQVPSVIPPDALQRAPRVRGSWIVGRPVLPVTIQGDERELRALLVVDEASGTVLAMNPAFADELQAAAESLFDVFLGEARCAGVPSGAVLPECVVFADETFAKVVGPALQSLGVPFHFDDTLPAWTEAIEGFSAFIRRGA